MRNFGESGLALLLLCATPAAAQEAVSAYSAAEWTPAADSAAGQFFATEQTSAGGRFSGVELPVLTEWTPAAGQFSAAELSVLAEWTMAAEQFLAAEQGPAGGRFSEVEMPVLTEWSAGDASAAPRIRQESRSRQSVQSGQASDLRSAGTVRYAPTRTDSRHELRWTFGFAPQNSDWDEVNWADQDLSNPACEVLHSKYSNSFFGRFSLGALSVQYAYRLAGRWEISASLTYSRFADRLHPAPEGLETKKLREHYLTLMPGIRCSWIRNRRFRLYSALEAGGQFAIRRGFFDDDYRTEFRGIGQFTLAGITVGRNFFFCTELGVGSRGVVLVGMGWRFDSKNTKR